MTIQIQQFTAYGVGRGNAPMPLICGIGHLKAVFYFLQTNEKQFKKLHTCNNCARF